MKIFFKRISVIIFSAYLCIAHPVAALADINDIIRNQYIAASVAVASLFSAFGFIPKAGNSALSEMVSRCVSDAQQAGYTVTRNGVPSVGIAISEGYTYLSKAFVSWVYSWSADNLSGVTGDTVVSYPQPNPELTYTFQPFVGSWTDYLEYGGFAYPANIVSIMTDAFLDRKGIDLSSCNYFVFRNHTIDSNLNSTTWVDSSGYYHFEMGAMTLAANTPITEVIHRYYESSAESKVTEDYYYVGFNGSHSSFGGLGIQWKYTNDGELRYSIYESNIGRFFGTGFARVTSTHYNQMWSTLNASIQFTTVGWDTTGDNPSKVHDIDEYAQTWAGDRSKQVDIDGTNQEGVPTTIPIDDVAVNVHVTVPAADIIAGLADAINAALDLSQSVAREGAISVPAAEELEKENVATDNVIELDDAQPIVTDIVDWAPSYVQPYLEGLLTKFPFSIPYDMYLILDSIYNSSSESIVNVVGTSPGSVSIDLDFDTVSTEYSVDSNAPVFNYDFYLTAFDQNYHFVGSLDFAPFGWFFQLCKTGMALLWLVGLLRYLTIILKVED